MGRYSVLFIIYSNIIIIFYNIFRNRYLPISQTVIDYIYKS